VIFFSQPDSVLRIDFLPVDTATMRELLSRASSVEYAGSSLRILGLEDLIAMKLFALHNGPAKRERRDSEDVVQLVLEHGWNVEAQLKPLCLRFADQALYNKIAKRIEGERLA
jgi:predicted nucleotidyltransferase